MQVQSMIPGKGRKVQTIGLAAFIGAAVLFALGFILMLAGDGAMMSRQLPLIFMTLAAIDICFATALTSNDVPVAEKARLRTLSIVGGIVVVIAATLIAASFRVGVFEIVIMLVALAGAPAMFKLGEIMGTKLGSAEKPARAPAKKEAAPEAPREG